MRRTFGAARLAALATLAAAVLLTACAKRPPPPEAPAPTPPAPEAAPAPIPFPADGRVIVEAREYPWSALGRVNTGGRGHCTGLLIGPSQVLASASCLYNHVEGRWWHVSELHFVAGYQRDRFLAAAPLRAYQVAPGYDPKAGATLANLARSWALLTLAEPIGRETGWLGLAALDSGLRQRILLGEAEVVPAGYRRGRPHAILLSLGCGLGGAVVTDSYIRPNCEVLPGDAGLPPLILTEGAPQAASDRLADDGPESLGAALRAAGISAGRGEPPRSGAIARPRPLATIDLFLVHLGYLAPNASDAGARAAAIRAFQKRQGLAVDGRPSLALLRQLIRAAQPPPAVG